MSRYYAFLAGSVSGPFEPAELGRILQPDLQVCAEGTEEWRAARDVEELASILPRSSAPVPPPLPTLSVGPPPLPSSPATPPALPPLAMPGAVPPGVKTAPPGVAAGAPAARPRPAEEGAPRDLPPKLRELWVICRNAPDELLLEQKKKYWKQFFKNEQQIVAAEMKRRNLS